MRPTIPQTTLPNTQKPKLSSSGKSTESQWGVSFEYFNQTDYFGLGGQNAKWFMSVLNCLTKMNKIPKETFIKSPIQMEANRYHKINWTQDGIPIQRRQFTWVNKDILENEDDFPFYQFQISISLGRVVGFWNNEHNLFHILMLDPAHNAQPSKKRNWQIRKTTILDCDYTTLTQGIAEVIRKFENKGGCYDIISLLRMLPLAYHERGLLFIALEDEYLQELEDKIGTRSITDVLELGISGL